MCHCQHESWSLLLTSQCPNVALHVSCWRKSLPRSWNHFHWGAFSGCRGGITSHKLSRKRATKMYNLNWSSLQKMLETLAGLNLTFYLTSHRASIFPLWKINNKSDESDALAHTCDVIFDDLVLCRNYSRWWLRCVRWFTPRGREMRNRSNWRISRETRW